MCRGGICLVSATGFSFGLGGSTIVREGYSTPTASAGSCAPGVTREQGALCTKEGPVVTIWEKPVWHQDRDRRKERRVTWLEMYFDLIFVVAIIQLGNLLSDDVSWSGAAWFSGVFALMWWSWTSTTLYFNRYIADDIPHRVIILAQIFALAHMAVFVGESFREHSCWFALALGVNRLLLAALYVRTWVHVRKDARFARRQVITIGLGGLLFVGSALVPEPQRYWLWAFAVAAEGLFKPTKSRKMTIRKKDLRFITILRNSSRVL